VERRLAAILAADVVGYSRLMGEDEAGTLAALTHLRKEVIEPLIATHKGRVVKLMGDGFLVEFQSVVDAVNCAIAWQRAVASGGHEGSLRFRIGLNLGDIIIEEGDIYGDGVNVAARLQAIAEPGGVCLSGTVFEHVSGRVDIVVDDRGEQQLKNIGKPVRVYTMRVDQSKGAAGLDPPRAPLLRDKPSIAVLPFTNMSGDAEQDLFSDGITEDIITALSRFRSLFVIARNSSFAYKDRAVNLRDVGRDLGVQYVVEGSVRRVGNRVRVTAQLIDAGTGSHLWAERYDRDLRDIFAVQDEITLRIVTSLVPRIEAEGLDLAKRKPPKDMRAYDYCLRARSLMDTPRGAADFEQAREYCDRAIQLDPSYARVHAYKAVSYLIENDLMLAENVVEWRMNAMKCAETAVALDPMDEVCHWSLGEAALQARQYDRARDHMARAREINPNHAEVLAVSGYIDAAIGNPEVGLRHTEMALERDPQKLSWHHWLRQFRGIILFMSGQFEEALRDFNLSQAPSSHTLRWRAATLVQLGRIDEARADVRALLAVRPKTTVSEVRQRFDFILNLDQHLDSLRQAGMPE
jgi:TolB-like protein/class 3 adenylate cyclase/Flp pilus assembly protein TadD